MILDDDVPSGENGKLPTVLWCERDLVERKDVEQRQKSEDQTCSFTCARALVVGWVGGGGWRKLIVRWFSGVLFFPAKPGKMRRWTVARQPECRVTHSCVSSAFCMQTSLTKRSEEKSILNVRRSDVFCWLVETSSWEKEKRRRRRKNISFSFSALDQMNEWGVLERMETD